MTSPGREVGLINLRRLLFKINFPCERGYYENVFLPVARSRGLNPLPSQQDVQRLIRRNITEEKIAQVKAWLQQMRKTTSVEIFPGLRQDLTSYNTAD